MIVGLYVLLVLSILASILCMTMLYNILMFGGRVTNFVIWMLLLILNIQGIWYWCELLNNSPI
jgi:hypothetical protein